MPGTTAKKRSTPAVPDFVRYASSLAVSQGTRRRWQRNPVKTMISAHTAGHGWTAGGSNANAGLASSNLNDTSDFLLGTQSISFTTSTDSAQTANVAKTLTTPINIVGQSIRLGIKFDQSPGLINLRVTDTSGNVTSQNVINPQGVALTQWPLQVGRWNVLDVPVSALSGPADLTLISAVRVTITPPAGVAVTTHLSYWAFTTNDPLGRWPNGVISLTFDDSDATTWSIARPYLDKYGYRGTLFPILDVLDKPSYMTTAQFQALMDQGWEVAGHASTNAIHALSVTGLTQAQRQAEFATIRAWMNANNAQSNAFAYPNGNHDAASEADLASYFDSGFLALAVTAGTTGPASPFAQPRMNAGSQYANMSVLIAQTVASKGHLTIVFHGVNGGASSNNCTTTQFQAIIDAVAASGCAVRTVGEVLSASS